MPAFHWDKHFQTGLHTVDAQHHVLVDLINRFGELLTQSGGASVSDIQSVLAELTDYTHYHFQDEEQMMLHVGLDARHVRLHQQFHADFLAELTTLQQDLTQQPNNGHDLLKFLTHWLAFHILGTDQAMARQVSAIEGGTPPAQAHEQETQIKEGATEPLLLALNGLFEQVSQRNHQLRDLNHTLEARVLERTQALSLANQKLEQIALTDVLTGLPNRRHAMNWLNQAWAQAAAGDTTSSLACMMIDADGFKQVNDRYGHDAGDEVLCQLARQLRHSVRTDDVVCRLGGDEFLIICDHTTLEGALHVAEKMHREVAKMCVPVAGAGQWLGSVSVGVALRTAAMQCPEDLMKVADQGLYQAKRNGRNRVESVA